MLSEVSTSITGALSPALQSAAATYPADPVTDLATASVSVETPEGQPRVQTLTVFVLGKTVAKFTPTSTPEGVFARVSWFGGAVIASMKEVRIEGDSLTATLNWDGDNGRPERTSAVEFLRRLVNARLT